jgi:ABC-type glycerol-3-phosphate transport system substrate-binding protein
MNGEPEVRKDIRIMATPFGKSLGGGVTSLGIPAAGDKATQDAAWSFIAFTMDAHWQRRLSELTFAPSALRTDLPAAVVDSQPVYAAMAKANVDVEPRLPPVKAISANYGEYRKIVMTAAVRLLSTDTPTADILQDTQRQLETAIPLK